MPKERPERIPRKRQSGKVKDPAAELKSGLRALLGQSQGTSGTSRTISDSPSIGLWLPSQEKNRGGLDEISLERPDYESVISQKILRRNLIPILERSVEVAVVLGDASLLGKLMDQSLGRAVEKRDTGGVTEIAMLITMKREPFSMNSSGQEEPDQQPTIEAEFEEIPQGPSRPAAYRNNAGLLILEMPVG